MTKPTLLVLAAGMGSRYGGLKQIEPVGPSGEIMIDYSIFDAIRAGFGKVVFVIRRDIETDFKQAVGDRFRSVIEVDYAFQDLDDLPARYSVPANRTKPWGTAHAIYAARSCINEPFAVINADDFYGAEGYHLLCRFLSAPDTAPDWALVGFVLRNTLSDHGSVARGVCRCTNDHALKTVTEHLAIKPDGDGALDQPTGSHFSGDERVSMNMWGFTPDLFDVLEAGLSGFLDKNRDNPKGEYQIPSVVDNQIQAGKRRVSVLETGAAWCGVTYPNDKPQVMAHIASLVETGHYPSPLWQERSE
jgi:dTDP-glucose pyrophosphorylase